jgi:flagellar hook-associated protein 2
MGTITSGIGLVSGINSGSIIDQLMAIEARPKTLMQAQVDAANKQKLAYVDLATRLTALKLSATTLKKTTTFQAASASSSNESVLTATASTGAAPGSFQFQVARLVTAQQSVSAGFAAMDSTVGAGTVTVELGGGEVTSETSLSQLNGGNGVRSGAFRITDRSGHSSVIDIGSAFTLDDVVKKINTSLDISIKAQIDGDKLVLTDLSGQTTANLSVVDLGGGYAATDLGLLGSVAANTLTGTNINSLGRSSSLAMLNDGLGVRTAKAGDDFQIITADASSFGVAVHGLTNVGQVLDAINTAGNGKVFASLSADGKGIKIEDKTGVGTLTVAAFGNSLAARDLGIEQTIAGATITGRPLLASIDSVLLSSLRGGQGLHLGQITIADRNTNPASPVTIDLTGAVSLQDVIDRINNSSAAVTAKIKDSGNGIQIEDTSGGSGDLVIADLDSTTAAELGVAGTYGVGLNTVKGANLQRRWVNENMLLSSYNGGKGVALGKFKITNSAGTATEIDLTASGASYSTIGDILKAINDKSAGVTASINANGDGILLTDTAGGAATMKVEDVTGRSAADLNILGTAAGTTLDGSFEKTYTVAADDTLQDVLDALNAPGFALSAAVINDGSSSTPYRMSLSARNSGRNGRFIFDAGSTSLQTNTLVSAQDAQVFYGGGNGQQPVAITSSTNQLTGVVKGLTINLNGVSSGPVTVNVSQNIDNVVKELTTFAEKFNDLYSTIRQYTKYDSATNTRGVLLGDGATQQIETQIFSFFQSMVTDAGTYKRLADVGVKIGQDTQIEVDEDRLRAAFAGDPESVRKLFTLYTKGDPAAGTSDKKGFGLLIEDGISRLIDPSTGLITRQSNMLDTKTTDMQKRMDDMDKLLASKKLRLQTQFANMESALASLQSQQKALDSFTPITYSSSTA